MGSVVIEDNQKHQYYVHMKLNVDKNKVYLEQKHIYCVPLYGTVHPPKDSDFNRNLLQASSINFIDFHVDC